MRTFVFPEQVVIQLVQRDATGVSTALPLPGVALAVHVFARVKADYHLGPFFSDGAGRFTLTRRALEDTAAAVLDTGLMDYVGISDASPRVELHVLTAEELQNHIQGRKLWGLGSAEQSLWPSIDVLLVALRQAPNGRLGGERSDGHDVVRDTWDGQRPMLHYELLVRDTAAG